MKHAAILGLSIVLLLVGAALVLSSLIDWNSYRGELESALAEGTGREIGVGGLSFRLMPKPTLRAANVTIANAPEGEAAHFAEIRSLDARVAFWPLLTGDLQVESIALVEPHLALERLPEGGGNWTFRNGDQGAGGDNVRIDRMTIENGTVSYRGAGGTLATLTDIDATVSAETLSGPFQGEGTMRYRNVPLELAVSLGNIARAGRRAPLDIAATLPEGRMTAQFRGGITAGDGLSAPEGSVTIEGRNLDAAVQAVARMTGRPMPVLPAAAFSLAADMKAADAAADFENLALVVAGERVSGNAAVSLAETPHVTLDLTASRVDLDKVLKDSPERKNARAKAAAFHLPAGFGADVNLRLNAVDYRGAVLRRANVRAGLADGVLTVDRATALLPGAADIDFSGQLTAAEGAPHFTGEIAATASNLRRFLNWSGLETAAIPEGRLGQFTWRSEVGYTSDAISLTGVQAALDSTRATGELRADLGETLNIVADIALDRLALDGYLPEREGERKPWAFPVLAGFNADLTMTAGRLSFGNAVLADTNARLTLKDKTLDVARFTIGDWDGAHIEASGQLSNMASDITADLNVTASGDHAGRILAASGVPVSDRRSALGAFALDAMLEGTAQKMAITATGTVGESDLRISGDMLNLAAQPAVALDFRLENGRLFELAGLFGIESGPSPAEETPVRLDGRVEGSRSQGTVKAEAMLGEVGVGEAGRIAVDGRYAEVQPRMNYRMTITARQAKLVPVLHALGLLDYRLAGAIGPVDGAATVVREMSQLRFDNLRIKTEDMQVNGSITLDHKGERPKLTAQLDATHIDVDALLPRANTPATQEGSARWSGQPFELQLLRDYDADIRLAAQALNYNAFSLSGAVLHVTLADGVLKTDPLSGGIFGGTTTLRLTADLRETPKIGLDAEFADVDLAEMSDAMLGNSLATGRLTFGGDFSAEGDSQRALLSSLDGEARINATNGALHKIDLPALSAAMSDPRAIDDFDATVRQALTSGQTAYTRISGGVTLNDGVAETGEVTADIEATEADLAATADLAAWRLSAQAEFRLSQVAEAPAVTIRLEGPIDAPEKTLGTDALRRYYDARVSAAALQQAIGNQRRGLDALLGRDTD